MADGKDYKATLRLPATSFPMKANLREREPQILDFWRHGKTYERMQAAAAARGGAPFRFHDGPPYANGHIHHGHILNKVLKDIVVKMRNLAGQPTEFRPGWDCHGLPIEHAVEKEIGREAARSDPSGLRHKCRDFARKWVDIQAKEFERLGVFASWDDPYLTMSHDYEALTLREFGRFVGAGAAYQGRKPVLWCHVCETALADAEVEYKDATSPSIYVRFPFTPSVGERIPALAGREGGVIIWTTTPWTLSSNLAIAFDAEATYVAEEVDGDVWIVAEALFEAFHKAIGRPEGTVITTFPGAVLDRAACRHPFIDRESMLIVGEHVTMDTGTGCVHTAPGFGEDDFVVGSRYGLPAYAPVNHQGRFTSEVPEYAGRLVFDCDDDVIAMLKDKGALLGAGKISHSYPHCWRSKNPVIFRATPQWFIKVDGAMTPQLAAEGAGDATLRARAFKAIENVRFIPSWGRDRITGMLKSRPDWCVSRQRHWGVPIVGTTCNTCGNVETSQALVDHVAAIFEREGADAWFDRPLSELIPADWKCGKCGGTDLGKVKDILDVWFDSGVSYAAVMEARLATAADPHPQTDLYLEGSDQHRGWFQSSLLASVGTRGQAPYKAVLTHGFVVDGAGRKLSKSEGNYIDPGKIMDVNGAELLRLWTAAEDYRDDIRLSDEILKGCVENYRKVRNTWRFMLGVVSDMDPATGPLPVDQMMDVDRWALARFHEVVARVRQSYEDYEFHTVVRALTDLFIIDLSAFYLDVTKDRLYCAAPDSRQRRSAQTAVRRILEGSLSLLAPILSFTAEEAYGHLPKAPDAPDSIFLVPLPSASDFPDDADLRGDMTTFLEVRGVVLKKLEEARAAKLLGHPLEARVTLKVKAGSAHDTVLRRFAAVLPELFVVSRVAVERADALSAVDGPVEVGVERIEGTRCGRCWNYTEDVGGQEGAPDLCGRCADVLKAVTP